MFFIFIVFYCVRVSCIFLVIIIFYYYYYFTYHQNNPTAAWLVLIGMQDKNMILNICSHSVGHVRRTLDWPTNRNLAREANLLRV